jgi:hypothetical protein
MRFRRWSLLLVGLLTACACPWNDELREFLHAHFWLPFAKHSGSFERPNVRRMDAPFAGMTAAQGDSPLARLRTAYQKIPQPEMYNPTPDTGPDVAPLRRAVAAARADRSLTGREKEEVDLVEAKIEMRVGEPDDSELLESAKTKFQAFLRKARTPEFRSEARGWLAHVHYLLGEQTAAGKIYLDELNRNGSNLSRETLLNSLHLNYGYDGGAELLAHLDEYFDTPEHAAFAIQLVTNPRWAGALYSGRFGRPANTSIAYQRIKDLLAKHQDLLRSSTGSDTLALLGMRTALRMGDPAAAREIAESVPVGAATRASPDFQWMSASALFLSREYAGAEQPLLALFHSKHASRGQKAAAAYGLCGVYWKTRNVTEQIRFALWLHAADRGGEYLATPSRLSDLSVYWASSGWDLGMLLETEASVDALLAFAEQNPGLPDIRLVKYAMAVRLAREQRYRESAELYRSIHAYRRAQRMQQLANLSQAVDRLGMSAEQRLEARYALAAFIAANPNGIYFNDALWNGMQRRALRGEGDSRLTGAERQELKDGERNFKDSQEERWRAYLILNEVVRDAGTSGMRRRAATLAISCLRGISIDRFGRQQEIRSADIELSRRLLHAAK